MFGGRSCQCRQTGGRSSCSQSHRTLTHAHIHRVAIGGRYIQRRHSRSLNSATSYRDRRTRFPAPPTSRPPSLPTRHTISPAAPTSSAAALVAPLPIISLRRAFALGGCCLFVEPGGCGTQRRLPCSHQVFPAPSPPMADSISLPPVLIVRGQPRLNNGSIVTAYAHPFPTPAASP